MAKFYGAGSEEPERNDKRITEQMNAESRH